MGHFGAKLLANDFALDILYIWDNEVKPEIKRKPKDWDGERVLKFYKENYYNGEISFGSTGENAELLAIGELLRANNISIPQGFKATLEMVVSIELSDPVIQEWENPVERRKVLTEFLSAIGGKCVSMDSIKVPTGPLEFSNNAELLKKIQVWLESNKQLDKEYPQFLKLLDRMCTAQLGWDYDDRYYHGTQQRLMLIAFYIGRWLKLPKEETMELVKKASKTVML